MSAELSHIAVKTEAKDSQDALPRRTKASMLVEKLKKSLNVSSAAERADTAAHSSLNLTISPETSDQGDGGREEQPDGSLSWDWSEVTQFAPLSHGDLPAAIMALDRLSLLSGQDALTVLRQYGLLDSILCLLGRFEFDGDLPSVDPSLSANVRAAAAAALRCLCSLSSPSNSCGPDLVLLLAHHAWAAHDLVRMLLRGFSEAAALLELIARSGAVGKASVVQALDDAIFADALYFPTPAGDSLPSSISTTATTASTASTASHAGAGEHEQPATVADAAQHTVLLLAPLRAAIGAPIQHTDYRVARHEGTLFRAEVKRLTRSCASTWQALPSQTWPEAIRVRTASEQAEAGQRLVRLQKSAKLHSLSQHERQQLNHEMAEIVLDSPAGFLDAMVESGVFTESKTFSREANKGDSSLHETDEFQAGRNAWACFGLQLVLLHTRVDCNPAVVGYSMLYPYTDNFLDDPHLTKENKIAFQKQFRRRLSGERVEPLCGRVGQLVWEQVALIERQWDRTSNPNVFHSLVAINDAQTRSLLQHLPPEDARYGNILDITIEKGGTSVLADVYVCAGDAVTRTQAAYAFHLGVALQIVDDLQDVASDVKDGQQTLFTVPAVLSGVLADKGARRLTHLLTLVIQRPLPHKAGEERVSGFDALMLQSGKLRMCTVTALKALMRAPDMFSKACLAQAAQLGPLPRAEMAKLAGMRTLLKLVKANAI